MEKPGDGNLPLIAHPLREDAYLPQPVIEHILSFLESKDAVRTCVLSKGWRNVWRDVPVIDIRGESFKNYYSLFRFLKSFIDSRNDQFELTSGRLWFEADDPKFVCNLRMDGVPDFVVGKFIGYVTEHGVRNVSLLYPQHVHGLERLFSCKTLDFLILHKVPLPRSLGFSNLTKLWLIRCRFGISEDDLFIFPYGRIDPFKDLVNLQTLLIRDCQLDSEITLFLISAPQLKELTLVDMFSFNIPDNSVVVLSCEKITSVKLICCDIPKFDAIFLPCLETVEIDVGKFHRIEEAVLIKPYYKKTFIPKLVNMFGKLSNARSVMLSVDTMDKIAQCPDALALHRRSPLASIQTLKVGVDGTPRSITFPAEVITFLLEVSGAKDLKLEFIQ